MPLPVAPTYSLSADAIVSVQMVKDELGIANATTTYDNRITRLVNGASAAVVNFCNRPFSRAYASELYGIGAFRPVKLILRRTPVLSVESVYSDYFVAPALLDTTEYDREDDEAGFLYMSGRWSTTAVRRGDVAQDYEPGSEERTYQVNYVAGYVSEPQVDAAGAWPGAVKAAHVGQLVRPAASQTQLWQCSTFGNTGNSEPAWGAPAVGDTRTDGTAVWTYLGTYAGGLGKTMPWDVEQAAIEAAVTWYRRSKDPADLVSERLGDASMTYSQDKTLGGRSQLPTSVQQALMPFVRLL